MSQPLLVLHERHTADDADIWRVAVRRGWTAERVNHSNIAQRLEGHSHVRYFGNTLHVSMICNQLPIRFHDIDLTSLASLRWATKRHIALLRYGDLLQPIAAPLFVKPAHTKWFEAKVYQPGEMIQGTPLIDDWIYTSDPVVYLDEVRCFCLDGKVLTCSLYRINRVAWDQSGVPEDQINFDTRVADTPIPEMVTRIYAEGKVPRAVVADFGRHPDGTWSLVEFNEPWASGLYLSDPAKCFDCIVESQEDRPLQPGQSAAVPLA